MDLAKQAQLVGSIHDTLNDFLGQRLKVYYTPSISFAEDTSLDYGMHIEGLLKKIQKEEKSHEDQ